eukprot:SAG22_NODE_484_length_9912_cov_23.425150_8_plen_262_part_00
MPDGPNFSYTFYVTWANVLGSCMAIAGVAFFQRTMSGWDFRPVFWITTVVKCTASFIDIIIVNRWNRAIGMPDQLTYLLGDAIVFQLCATLDFMPAVVLTSKLCPKNVESTVYALLAGFQNFGTQVSRTAGVAMLGWFSIRAEPGEVGTPEEGCDFSGLPMLLFVAHFCLPLLTVPLTFVLIPDANMRDDLTVVEGIHGNPAASGGDGKDAGKDESKDSKDAAKPDDPKGGGRVKQALALAEEEPSQSQLGVDYDKAESLN